MKMQHSLLVLFNVILIGIVLVSCSLPTTPSAGVSVIHPADGVFIPFEPYIFEAQAIGGEFAALNFLVNGVTIASVPIDQSSTWEIANFTWTPPTTGEYYLSVDGIGGPGGGNRYVSRNMHICVTRSVTTVTPGYTGTGCDPMPPTPGFTSLHAVPDPIYYDALPDSPACPTDLDVYTELNVITYIDRVRMHFDIYAGTDTTPFLSLEDDLEWKVGGTYVGGIALSSLDLAGLHGGDGRISIFVFAFDIGSARVALSDPITVQVRRCVASTPTLGPSMLLTSTSLFVPINTSVPLPTSEPACSDYTNPDSCGSAPGGICKWEPVTLTCFRP